MRALLDTAAEAGREVHAEPARAELGWQRVVLVCGDCEDRKDGPRHVDAKAARRALKSALRDSPHGRARVVVSGCLGPCEKKALTLVAVGGGAEPTLAYAVCRHDDLDAAARRIAGR